MSWGVCERALKPHRLGKASRGKPRSKPESGNPTFRDCRGARGNVTLSLPTECAHPGSIPTRIGFQEQVLNHLQAAAVKSRRW